MHWPQLVQNNAELYIESESSSQKRDMEKWNTNPCKQQIINYLNKTSDEDLQSLLDFINKREAI